MRSLLPFKNCSVQLPHKYPDKLAFTRALEFKSISLIDSAGKKSKCADNKKMNRPPKFVAEKSKCNNRHLFKELKFELTRKKNSNLTSVSPRQGIPLSYPSLIRVACDHSICIFIVSMKLFSYLRCLRQAMKDFILVGIARFKSDVLTGCSQWLLITSHHLNIVINFK